MRGDKGRSLSALDDRATQRLASPEPVTSPKSRASHVNEKSVLLFLHIPKTAGSTLREIVRERYSPTALFVQDSPQPPPTSPYLRYLRGEQDMPGKGRPGFDPNVRVRKRLSELPGERRNALRAIVGHLWFGLHDAFDPPATYMTVLRDPVERVLSLYYYHKASNGLTGTLEEYLDAGRDFEIDNGQTRYLCGQLEHDDVRFAPCNREMLARAQNHLIRAFSVVGTVERFDESLLLMNRAFGWSISSYERVNVNLERPPGHLVPHSIRQRIAQRNRFDAELYEFAGKLLDQRLSETRPPAEEAAERQGRRVSPGPHPMISRLRALGRETLRLLTGRK